MSKFVLILSLMSFLSPIIYGQQNGSMESNRYSYLSLGKGPQYTAVKFGYDLKPHLYLEVQSLTDGGGLWKESNPFNDWRALSFLGAVNLPRLRTELRVGLGIMHTSERGSTFFRSMGIAPQISNVIHVHKKIALGTSVIWPISSAQNLILPTTVFCIEYRIGRYVKEDGLH